MRNITLEPLGQLFSICKVRDFSGVDIEQPFCFTGCTDEEKSLICPTEAVPCNTVSHDDGWECFRICGELDFSLIGILAQITKILASNKIGIIAVSTYNTDYVFTREAEFDSALLVLKNAGYSMKETREAGTRLGISKDKLPPMGSLEEFNSIDTEIQIPVQDTAENADYTDIGIIKTSA